MIYECAQNLNGVGTFKEEAWIHHENHRFPLVSFKFGSEDPSAPCFVVVGGIHGLEKIGTHVVTAYLQTLIRLLKWDASVQSLLEDCRLIIYPLANPVGMYQGTRSNGNGVDLMRNAPVEARERPAPIVGGHRLSPSLPWYRGGEDEPLEIETDILCEFIRQNCFQSKLSIVLDVHSGFGLIDRLWFPFAFSRAVFPDAHKILALKKLLDHSYPNHIYTIEPQNKHYMAHGDIWDYIYLEHRRLESEGVLIPLCLEMGSWHWVRKNPKQLFHSLGMFNPVLPHRLRRAQRRHLMLFDFLLKALTSTSHWAELPQGQALHLQRQAKKIWYGRRWG